jgi:hypothetical protein
MTWFQSNVVPPKKSDFNVTSNNSDPLSRRIMTLVAPIHSMQSIIGGSLSHIILNSKIMRENVSQDPHPSFPYHESCLTPRNTALQDPNGYEEHASFFHPRRIQADHPRHDFVQNTICNDKNKMTWDGSNVAHTHESQSSSDNHWQQSDPSTFGDAIQNVNHSDSIHHHPFGFTYEDSEIHDTITKTRSKKQKRMISSDNGAVLERGWEQVGQVTTYYSSEQWNDTFQERETKQSKKNKKKSKKSKKQENTDKDRDIRELMEPNLTHTKESNETSNQSTDRIFPESLSILVSRTEPTKTNTSKIKYKASRGENSSTIHSTEALKTISMETMELFSETYDVKNAGSSTEALDLFLQLARDQGYITWTIVFYDNICSSPFLPSNKKYCTPKGPPCRMWNCTCDSQVRAMQASAPVLGAMFVFPTDERDDELFLFFLPLCPTIDPDSGPNDIDDGYERMANWPSLVITCETTLHQRWETFRLILLDKAITKVTFNAQMALMPFHYHSANDVVNNEKSKIPSMGYLDLDLPNIWDLR